jgi:hypothetical protein
VPWLFVAKGVVKGDDVRRCLLDGDVSLDLQQAQDGCLPGSWGAGDDVSKHGNSSYADRADGVAGSVVTWVSGVIGADRSATRLTASEQVEQHRRDRDRITGGLRAVQQRRRRCEHRAQHCGDLGQIVARMPVGRQNGWEAMPTVSGSKSRRIRLSRSSRDSKPTRCRWSRSTDDLHPQAEQIADGDQPDSTAALEGLTQTPGLGS